MPAERTATGTSAATASLTGVFGESSGSVRQVLGPEQNLKPEKENSKRCVMGQNSFRNTSAVSKEQRLRHRCEYGLLLVPCCKNLIMCVRMVNSSFSIPSLITIYCHTFNAEYDDAIS